MSGTFVFVLFSCLSALPEDTVNSIVVPVSTWEPADTLCAVTLPDEALALTLNPCASSVALAESTDCPTTFGTDTFLTSLPLLTTISILAPFLTLLLADIDCFNTVPLGLSEYSAVTWPIYISKGGEEINMINLASWFSASLWLKPTKLIILISSPPLLI